MPHSHEAEGEIPDSQEEAIARAVDRLTPEDRFRLAVRLRGHLTRGYRQMGPGSRVYHVITRVVIGVYRDGFIHAGNFAYMAILSLFPFFITAAALLSLFGQSAYGDDAASVFLATLPANVAAAVKGPLEEVMSARTGPLLWFGGLVGLWTVGSLIETIRDILRRAYGTVAGRAFWQYRLGAIGIILISVILLLASFSLNVLITGIEQAIDLILPQFSRFIDKLALSRFVPAIGLFLAMYLLFLTLTPGRYRARTYPKWPGALLVASWWIGVTLLLPVALRYLAPYDLTYGSMAGVMIVLFFFWLVGLGVVIGAELNAALAATPEERDVIGQGDNRARATASRAD